MARVKLKFVNTWRDPRNGTKRHQFRRKGFRKVLLRGEEGSAEFMAHYGELLAQSEKPIAHVGTSRIMAGTLDALKAKWLAHELFTSKAKATQDLRRRIIEKFCDCVTPGGRRFGDNFFRGITAQTIQEAIKGKPPTVQKDWLKALRPFAKFAQYRY